MTLLWRRDPAKRLLDASQVSHDRCQGGHHAGIRRIFLRRDERQPADVGRRCLGTDLHQHQTADQVTSAPARGALGACSQPQHTYSS